MTALDSEVILNGARLAYRDHGTGKPVVFLHGTPSHSFIWRDIAPEVERAGYRVVLFDLVGYGRSERPLTHETSVHGQVHVLRLGNRVQCFQDGTASLLGIGMQSVSMILS